MLKLRSRMKRTPRVVSGPVTDPHFANVVLLLRGNGAGGYQDYSTAARTFTPHGGATVFAEGGAFGGDALDTDGASEYFTCPASPDFAFGTNPFTIEFWGRKAGGSANGYDTVLSTDTSNGSAVDGWFLELSGNRGFGLYRQGAPVIEVAGSPNDSTGHWWAFSRTGGTLYALKDGVVIGSVASTHDFSLANGDFGVGGNAATVTYLAEGRWDQIRVTKNVGRYSGNYAVPTQAFPTQ